MIAAIALPKKRFLYAENYVFSVLVPTANHETCLFISLRVSKTKYFLTNLSYDFPYYSYIYYWSLIST